MADAWAGIGEGVEGLGVELGDALSLHVVDEVAHGARRGEAGVDPAAEADDGQRPTQILRVEAFDLAQGVGFSHWASVNDHG